VIHARIKIRQPEFVRTKCLRIFPTKLSTPVLLRARGVGFASARDDDASSVND
jgi:hypothetical protein